MIEPSNERSQDAETVVKRLRRALGGSTQLAVAEIENALEEISNAVLFAMNKEAVKMVVGPAKGGL